MTDIRLLALLNHYNTAQRNVITSMIWAMEYFERGREHVSWVHLIDWCENKDRRDELWSKLERNYPRAVTIKEGYSYN